MGKLREAGVTRCSWSLTVGLAIFDFKIDTQPRRWRISVLTRTLDGYVSQQSLRPSSHELRGAGGAGRGAGGKVCRVKL